jgi:hypothetical protein
MSNDATKVDVAVTGIVAFAPAGSTLPTNAVDNLDGAFTELGYMSEDGVVGSRASDNTEIKAWQNGDTVRVIKTTDTATKQFTMIETTDDVLEVYYGGSFSGGNGEITGEQGTRGSWVVEYRDGDKDVREVLPDAQVTEWGDTPLVNGSPVSFPVTITAYPDVNGVKIYRYADNTTSS